MTGPRLLQLGDFQVFVSAHYSGEDLVMKFGADEPWKKVFGPVFVYLNSLPAEGDPISLWEDAKQQVDLVIFFTKQLQAILTMIFFFYYY